MTAGNNMGNRAFNLKNISLRWIISDLKVLYTTNIYINQWITGLFFIAIMVLYANDSQIYNYMNDTFNNEFVEGFFGVITLGGDGVVILVMAIIFGIHPKTSRFGKTIFSANLYAGITIRLLKTLFGRPRPGVIEPLFYGPVSGFQYDSMPSGHSAGAFALAVLLAFKYPKYRWVFYIVALLIAFSRVFTGMHWPADILAGSIIGWGSAKHAIKCLMIKHNDSEKEREPEKGQRTDTYVESS